MGRLTSYLSEDYAINKPTFFFVHHMSPHWPYITNEDCSYKNYPGNKNLDGYRSAYICTLKKILECLEKESNEIKIGNNIAARARKSVVRMADIGR